MRNFVMMTHGRYRIGSREALSAEQCELLVRLLEAPVGSSENLLGGRAAVNRAEVPGLGNIVVKHYVRGGLLRFAVRHTHIMRGIPRPVREFELLEEATAAGVRTPQPVAFALRGRALYRGWLFTRDIFEHESLATLAARDDQCVPAAMHEVGKQIRSLIARGIFHVDLHPGNVIIDRDERVHIVDFDKAYFFSGSPRALRDQYVRRWRRAVIKHALPEALSEMMCIELRQSPWDPEISESRAADSPAGNTT